MSNKYTHPCPVYKNKIPIVKEVKIISKDSDIEQITLPVQTFGKVNKNMRIYPSK